jgi:hypothetical protein
MGHTNLFYLNVFVRICYKNSTKADSDQDSTQSNVAPLVLLQKISSIKSFIAEKTAFV